MTAALIVLVISRMIAPPKCGALTLRAILCTRIWTTVQPPRFLGPCCDDLYQEFQAIAHVHFAVCPFPAEWVVLPSELTRPFPHSRRSSCVLNVQPSPLAHVDRRGRFLSAPGAVGRASIEYVLMRLVDRRENDHYPLLRTSTQMVCATCTIPRIVI